MTWGERRHGSHSEGSLEAPHTTWYLGEGATHSGFQLFYLLQNPSPQTAEVTVTYLLPEGRAPKVETYQVAPESRRTIWVNLIEGLEATDISATIHATRPNVVERAMYRDAEGETWAAGHGGAGLTGRSNSGCLARARPVRTSTSSSCSATPTRPAHVRATYLLPEGAPVVKEYTLARPEPDDAVRRCRGPAAPGHRRLNRHRGARRCADCCRAVHVVGTAMG